MHAVSICQVTTMDRSLLHAQIRQAEVHVADIELRVWRQRQFVHALLASGKDASQAETLLAELLSFEADCICRRAGLLAKFGDEVRPS